MQWMLDFRTYGLKIQFNTTTEGTVDWVGDQIVYKDIQFTMAELRSMIHELVAEPARMMVVASIPTGQKHCQKAMASINQNAFESCG